MDHAATMRRAYDLFNAHDVESFGDLLAEDMVEHEVSPGLAPTKEGVEQFFAMFFAAFSDIHWNVEDILVDGDKVVGRVTITGTHDGEFMGIRRPARASASRASTSFASATTALHTSTGAPPTRWG